MPAPQATSGIPKQPFPTGVGKEAVFQFSPLVLCQCPGMTSANDRFVLRIEAAPDQRAVTGFVVKEALVAKASVICVRLLEDVVVAALRACDGDRFFLHSLGRTMRMSGK